MRILQMSLLAFGLMVTAACAPAGESPEAVIRAFHTAMLAEGPQRVVPRFTHPDESARLKAMLLPRIRQSFDGVGDDFVAKVFGKSIPLADIEAMSPADFMAAFMWNSRLDGSEFKQPQIISIVQNGESAHVVLLSERTGLDGKPVEQHEVIRLKAMKSTWRLTLDPRMEAYVATLIDE